MERLAQETRFLKVANTLVDSQTLLESLSVQDLQILGYKRASLNDLIEDIKVSLSHTQDLMHRDDLLHTVIGLLGECAELIIEDDPAEELGDIVYYLTALSVILGVPEEDIVDNLVVSPYVLPEYHKPLVPQIIKEIEHLCNLSKKVFIYKQDKANLLPREMCRVFNTLSRLTHIERLIDDNTAKLTKRYPEGFSTRHSELRLDKSNSM